MVQVIAVLAVALAGAFLVVGLGIYLYVRFVVARRRPPAAPPRR